MRNAETSAAKLIAQIRPLPVEFILCNFHILLLWGFWQAELSVLLWQLLFGGGGDSGGGGSRGEGESMFACVCSCVCAVCVQCVCVCESVRVCVSAHSRV